MLISSMVVNDKIWLIQILHSWCCHWYYVALNVITVISLTFHLTLKSVYKVSNIRIIHVLFMENIINDHTWPIAVNKNQCNIWRQLNSLNSIGFIITHFTQRHLTQIIKADIINGCHNYIIVNLFETLALLVTAFTTSQFSIFPLKMIK